MNKSPIYFTTYDADGNLHTVTQPDGLTTAYSYDTLNRLNSEVVKDTGGNTVASYTYTLNADGLRASVLEHQKNADGSFTDDLVTYTYDADGRLTGEDHDDGADGPSDGDESIAYDFNLANNRVDELIALGSVNTPYEFVSYLYNGNDELLAEEWYSFIRAADALNRTYTYDANGSTRSITADAPGSTQTANYTWDLRNRMTGLDAHGSASGGDGDLSDPGDTVYTYDTSGVRESEVVVTSGGGAATYYLNDPLNPTGYTKAIEEHAAPGASAAPIRSYIFGLRVEGQSDAANGTLYLLTDGHGSTRAVVNTSGAVIQRYDYDAYGNPFGAASPGPVLGGFNPATAKTPWLFGGDGLYDPSTGWAYELARWRSGFRFVSQDSYMGDPTSPLSLHKYIYANGNPIDGQDPSGNIDFTLTGVLSTAALITFILTAPGDTPQHGSSTSPYELLNYPGDQPTFWFQWTSQQRSAWFADFDAKLLPLIDASAAQYNVPQKLLAVIIANEMLDMTKARWATKNSFFFIPMSRGPAAIRAATVARDLPGYVNNSGYSMEELLASPPDNIDIAAQLLAVYIQKLGSDAQNGTMGGSFLQLVTGATPNQFVSLANLNSRDHYDPPAGMLAGFAAVWNNGPKVDHLNNIAIQAPHAWSHGQFATMMGPFFTP